jgi:hypothetical protein
MPALALTGTRAAAGAALAPATETDPPIVETTDSLTPPALMLEWANPWFAPASVAGGRGLLTATLNVLCFAARIEPEPGIVKLEELVSYVIGRLQGDLNPWTFTNAQTPVRVDMNAIPMFLARLSFTIPIYVNGG